MEACPQIFRLLCASTVFPLEMEIRQGPRDQKYRTYRDSSNTIRQRLLSMPFSIPQNGSLVTPYG